VVTWGLQEDDLAAGFKAHYHGRAFYAGAPPLRTLGALYRNLSAVVVNDTGMLHLAAACSVPLVGVFGPTDPADWCPLGKRFLSVRGADNLVANVTVEQAWERLKTIIN
jgi:heptosyltransferase I